MNVSAFEQYAPLIQLVTSYLDSTGAKLAPRERAEVVRIAQGLTMRESAQLAQLSFETIRTFRRDVLRKLDLRSVGALQAQLLSLALRR